MKADYYGIRPVVLLLLGTVMIPGLIQADVFYLQIMTEPVNHCPVRYT